MKYVSYFLRGVIMAIGIYMMVKFPNPATPPFISGMAFTLTGIALGLQGFTWCGDCSGDKACCESKK